MSAAARLLILVAIMATGCGRTRQVARDAAVTTFRVIDAPANYVRRRLDAQESGTTETTTTTTQTTVASSDVVTPGRPVAPRRQMAPGPQPTNPETTPRRPRRDGTASSETGSTPPAPSANFPTARPVPGKPGFVYSVDPQGGIVDVTGYKSGDKAKDPYTKQIFIVP